MDHTRPDHEAIALRVLDDSVGGIWPCERCGELTPVRGSWRLVFDDHEEIRCPRCILTEALSDVP